MEGSGRIEVTPAACRACGSSDIRVFHHQSGVPANSCLLLVDEAEALAFPTGDIDLGLCVSCGFIQNGSFDPSLAEYSERYEETQAFSPKFVEFAKELAGSWVRRHGLHGKRIVEIGCGKGEFLTYLAEAGIGSGVGIDPGVDPVRIDSPAGDRLTWVQGFFDESYGPLEADAVVCRHTLEHISDVSGFLATIRRAVTQGVVALFELPDAARVLEEAAFWDVYYEHCSYFTEGSVARLFERCGFEVIAIDLAYDDQYLVVEARASSPRQSGAVDDMDRIRAGVDHFAARYAASVDQWKGRLGEVARRGGTSVIWGASSKGVSFLVAAGETVAAAVDINPNKHGMFIAGTGHRIIAPDDLVALAPDLVVVMNPIYLDEIGAELRSLGVAAEVTAV